MQPANAISWGARFRWGRLALIAVLLLIIAAAVVQIIHAAVGGAASPRPRGTSSEQMRAAAARLAPTDGVVGVSAGGRHRAYPLRLLMRFDSHVVNDFLGGVPITVTFCGLDDCVRVFTVPGRRTPLEVSTGGPDPANPRKMLLRVGETLYRQDTLSTTGGPAVTFPYADQPYERTSWADWREAYPDSDVYTDARGRP